MASNTKVIKRLREEIETTTETLKNLVPDDDGLVLQMGRDILTSMYATLIELLHREIVRLNREVKELLEK